MTLFETAALLIILIVDRLSISNSQSFIVPWISCPHYFRYEKIGNENIGKITLLTSFQGEINLKVRFSQRESVQMNGNISLYQNDETTMNFLNNGQPIAYRINFPLAYNLPRITHISINGHTVCSAPEDAPPRTSLELEHILRGTLVHTVPNFFSPTTIDYRNNPQQALALNVSQEIRARTVSYFYSPTSERANDPQETIYVDEHLSSNITMVIPLDHRPRNQTPTSSNSRSTNDVDSLVNQFSACGREGGTDVVVPLISGGTVVERSQFPWLAVIYKKQASGLQVLCGGTLISSRSILTAAHCFSLTQVTADRITVYLGRHDLNNYSEENVVSRDVQTLLMHPDYRGRIQPDADLALLTMEFPVRFTQFIRPICLWNDRSDVNFILGMQGVVVGWGSDENGNGVSALPKMVRATIVSEADCLRDSAVFQSLTTNRTLCAGDRDNSGPCNGDSGAGLMIKRNDRWFLRAVVSIGQRIQRRCYLQNFVVYCDVAKHMSWIRGAMID